jgi:outer membrane protein assembly factor BamB
MSPRKILPILTIAAAVGVTGGAAVRANGPLLAAQQEQAMFAGNPRRNMVSSATGLPAEWDVRSGVNVKWSASVGSQSYAGPVVADGKVFVGTNNEGLRNPDLPNDRGVVMAFDAETGEFLWQYATDKLSAGRVNDWPLQGVCSTPFVDGDRLWYVSNQAHVVSLDTNGHRDSVNDGAITDEVHVSPIDGDVIWSYDMIGEVDAFPHNLATSSPLVVGDLVFVSTGNGVDEGHINIPSPFGPSFLALNKNTGELVWENSDPGESILHGTWTNPTYAEIDGTPMVIFPGGDGIVRAFVPETGEVLWTFDANPKDSEWRLGGRGTRNNIISTAVIYDNKMYIGVGQDPEHGEAPGNFWVVDVTGRGDITGDVVWHRGGEDFHRTISTAAIQDDILYISDLSGFLYALDAQTGEHYWTYDTFAAVWGSAFVADGKVYLGDEDGDVIVLQAGKELVELAEMNMGASVYTTPYAKDGVLYVLSRNRLFALEVGAQTVATN